MSQEETKAAISKVPINILFDPDGVKKKDVWEIDLMHILETLVKILEKADKKDLRIAGMAALSSSLIYRMKVENIFALQKAAMENKPIQRRSDIDIQMLDIPFRHESTYPVSLEELLDLLENLIGTIANPRERRTGLKFEPVDVPNFKNILNNLENVIGEYQGLILKKLESQNTELLSTITKDLNTTDSIRCFFAVLFLARDEKIDLLQIDDDIKVTLIKE